MIDTQTIFEIHHLKEQGMSERKIAKTLHLTRKTIRKYLDNPIRKRTVIHRKSKLDPFKNEIKQLLEQDCRVSAEVVKQRIESMGYAYTLANSVTPLCANSSPHNVITHKNIYIFPAPGNPGESREL